MRGSTLVSAMEANTLAVSLSAAARVQGDMDEEAIRRKVIVFRGIQDAARRGVRSNDRIRAQPNADATQLERASILAQRRDLMQGTNLNPLFSILSFSDNDLIAKAVKLGVSLGSSHFEKIKSAKTIKDSELDRTVNLLSKNIGSVDPEDPHNLILNRAASLSEDLVEDEIDRDLEEILGPVVPLERTKISRPRKDYSTTFRRRSVRIKKLNKRT